MPPMPVGAGRDRVVACADRAPGRHPSSRIYEYQGSIVEEYALADAAYTDKGFAYRLEHFSFDYDHGLLTVETDDGTVQVALRSAMGGA